MKFIKEEISGKETTRYMFAIGKQEAMIIVGLLEKSVMYLPKTFIAQPMEARMRNMIRVINEAIPKMPENNNKE